MLSSPTYAASLAGLHFSLGAVDEGIYIGVSGYNDKLPMLLRTVLDALVNRRAEFKVEKVAVFKEEVCTLNVTILFLASDLCEAGAVVQEPSIRPALNAVTGLPYKDTE